MMKRNMSRVLRQSILEICKATVNSEGSVEIDGIICITVGEEESDEIVVKMHEKFGTAQAGRQQHGVQGPRGQGMVGPSAGGPIRIMAMSPKNKQPMASMPRTPSKAMVRPVGFTPEKNALGGKAQQSPHHNPSYSGAGGPRGMPPSGRGMDSSTPKPGSSGASNKHVGHSSDGKKQQPPPQMPIDETVIKIEIESDDEGTEEMTKTEGGEREGKASGSQGSSSSVVCNVCEMTLQSVAALKRHVSEVHHASVCEICWQPFASKAELDNHMKVHAEKPVPSPRQEKPSQSPRPDVNKNDKRDSTPREATERFKCGVCGNSSDARANMVEHLRSGHEFQGCFTCLLCGEYFPNKPTFTIHRKLSHPKAIDKMCMSCGVGLKQHEYDFHMKECTGEDPMPPTKPAKKDSDWEKEFKKSILKNSDWDGPPAKRPCHEAGRSSWYQSGQSPQNGDQATESSGRKNEESEQSGAFQCQICHKYLDNYELYERHTMEVHQCLACPFCVALFKSTRAVQYHMTRHTGALPLTCDKCGLGNHNEDELKRHEIVRHGVEPSLFTCPQCNLLMDSQEDFVNHMKLAHNVEHMLEDELEKHVVLDGDDQEDEDELYDEEEEMYPGEEQFDGAEHEYPMAHEENYDDMEENDDDEYDEEEMIDAHPDSTVTCNICERIMPTVRMLKQHIHEVHRAVVCDICWRPFLSKPELETHMKTHQGEGSKEPQERKEPPVTRANSSSSNISFKCGVCGCSYEARRAMVEHLKASHEFLGCFTCMLCGEFFPNKPTFTIHRKLSHNEANEVTCQSCGVGLKQHEYEPHRRECECGGIDIKEAEWEGRKDGKGEKD